MVPPLAWHDPLVPGMRCKLPDYFVYQRENVTRVSRHRIYAYLPTAGGDRGMQYRRRQRQTTTTATFTSRCEGLIRSSLVLAPAEYPGDDSRGPAAQACKTYQVC